MENSNYLIIIAIKEGENFPLQETFRHFRNNSNHNKEHDCLEASSAAALPQSQLRIVFEAKFNEKSLRSDFIPFLDSRPQLQTELAWQLDRKSLHLFRIERKPIKLKCYIVNEKKDGEGSERVIEVGSILFDLRNTQDTISPKFEWRNLLNYHYKGSSHQRPRISVALVLTKCDENEEEKMDEREIMYEREIMDEREKDNGNNVESENKVEIVEEKKGKSRTAAKRDHATSVGSQHSNSDFVILSQPCSKLTSLDTSLEYDLNVKLKNGYYHLWDAQGDTENDCTSRFTLSFTIASASLIHKLFRTTTQMDNCKPFHLRFNFLGTTIRTQSFADVNLQDFSVQKTTFKIATPNLKTLQTYLEFHPSLDIQLYDSTDNAHGFVSISLDRFFHEDARDHLSPIQGTFLMFPQDESIEVNDPFPSIGISIELSPLEVQELNLEGDDSANKSKPKQSSYKSELSPLLKSDPFQFHGKLHSTPLVSNQSNHSNHEKSTFSMKHFCVTIDLRTIKMIDPNWPNIDASFLQFSYAFFGLTDTIKTYPTITLSYDSEVIIPHGFCSFNFATTSTQLEKTFRTIPLVIELIEKGARDTLIGTAHIELSDIFDSIPTGKDLKQSMHKISPVLNEENKPIGQLQVILCLQNFGETQIPPLSRSPDVSVLKANVNLGSTSEGYVSDIRNIDELLEEAALEIETWKDRQLSVLREELKEKEVEYSRKFEERLSKREKELENKLAKVCQLESKFKASLNEVKDKEESLIAKEVEINEIQKVLNTRYGKLNGEIGEAIEDIKVHYEQKLFDERDKVKSLENEKRKMQERIYALERKVKEKERQLKQMEEQITNNNKSRTNSVTSIKSIQMRPSVSPMTSPSKSATTNSRLSNGTSSSFRSRSISNDRSKMSTPFSTSPVRNLNTTNSRIIGKEINIKGNKKNSMKDKLEIIERIKLEKKALLDSGLGKNDPLILEIDDKLRMFRQL